MFEINKEGTRAIGDTNAFANICGYFFNVNITNPELPNYNNGFNCNHPCQEENNHGIGSCYAWSCPLAWQADAEDFKSFGWDPEEYEEGDWMVTDSPELLEKIRKMI